MVCSTSSAPFPGMTEDVTELVLNVKDIVVSTEMDEPVTMYLRASGPGAVTVADIEAPTGVEVHNPDLHLATLGEGAAYRWSSPSSVAGATFRLLRARRWRTGGPHPCRRDLLARPQGDLQGRGHPCRAAHRLRPFGRGRGDQAEHACSRRGRQRRQDPGRVVRPGPRPQRRAEGLGSDRPRWTPTWPSSSASRSRR